MYDRVFAGLRSHGAGKLATQAISWAGTIYVARTLDSRAFGAFGIATVVLNHATLIYDGTLTESLVQRPPETSIERRSVFMLLMGVGVSMASIMLALARPAERLVTEPGVAALVQVMALVLLVTSLGVLPNAQLIRTMRFSRLATISALQSLGTTAVTVWLAYSGAEVWSLAFGTLTGVLIRTALLNVAEPSLMRPTFRLGFALRYFRFGGVLFLDTVLWRLYTSIDTLFLGRWAGARSLGFYTLARQIAEMPLEKISTVVNDVSLPAYAELSNRRSEARRLMLETIRSHATIGFPIFWGLAATSHTAVLAALGPKWSMASFPLAALSIIAPIRLIGSVETPAMTGLGRPGVLVRTKGVIVPCMIVALLIGCRWRGIDGAGLAWLVAFPICYGAAFRCVLDAVDARYADLLPILRGPAVSAALMAAAVRSCDHLLSQSMLVMPVLSDPASPQVLTLAIDIVVGALVYTAALRGLDRQAYRLAKARVGRLAGLRRAS